MISYSLSERWYENPNTKGQIKNNHNIFKRPTLKQYDQPFFNKLGPNSYHVRTPNFGIITFTTIAVIKTKTPPKKILMIND